MISNYSARNFVDLESIMLIELIFPNIGYGIERNQVKYIRIWKNFTNLDFE